MKERFDGIIISLAALSFYLFSFLDIAGASKDNVKLCTSLFSPEALTIDAIKQIIIIIYIKFKRTHIQTYNQ